MGFLKSLSFMLIASIFFIFNNLYAKELNGVNNDKLNSAEVASLATVAAVDRSEILISILALNKKSGSDVNDFAKMMVDQHGSNLTQIMEMANNSRISALKSSAAEKIKINGNKEMLKLAGLQDEQFDKAYVDAMVNGHQAALDMIDKQLMKTAKSEKVKLFLTNTKNAVIQHLNDAKALQASMKS